MTEEKAGIAKALTQAQAKFHAAKKDSINPHFKSNYADLASVIDAIKGPMAEFGLAYLQPVLWEDGCYMVETIILHSSGEKMSLGKMRVALNPTETDGVKSEYRDGKKVEYPVKIPADIHNVQKVGAAITYTRRYHLSSALGISQEDDDGNSVSQPGQSAQRFNPPAANRSTPTAPTHQAAAPGPANVGGPSPKQLEYVSKLTAALGVTPRVPKTNAEASQMIADLTAEKAKREKNPAYKPVGTDEVPW